MRALALGLLATSTMLISSPSAFALTNPNDSCAGFFLCAQPCGQADAACQQACAPSDNAELMILSELSQCAQTNCAADPTAACINSKCPDEFGACFGPYASNPDGTCAGFQMCTQSCASPNEACAQSCSFTDPDEIELLNSLNQCMQTNCGAAPTPQCLASNCLDQFGACLDGASEAPVGCGAVTEAGMCVGDTLVICVGGEVVETDCAAEGKECLEGEASAACIDSGMPGEEGGADEGGADEGGAGEGGADEGGAGEGGADEGGADEGGADEGGADEGGADEGGPGEEAGESADEGGVGGIGVGGAGNEEEGAGGTESGTDGDEKESSGGCVASPASSLPSPAGVLLALGIAALAVLRRRRA